MLYRRVPSLHKMVADPGQSYLVLPRRPDSSLTGVTSSLRSTLTSAPTYCRQKKGLQHHVAEGSEDYGTISTAADILCRQSFISSYLNTRQTSETGSLLATHDTTQPSILPWSSEHSASPLGKPESDFCYELSSATSKALANQTVMSHMSVPARNVVSPTDTRSTAGQDFDGCLKLPNLVSRRTPPSLQRATFLCDYAHSKSSADDCRLTASSYSSLSKPNSNGRPCRSSTKYRSGAHSFECCIERERCRLSAIGQLEILLGRKKLNRRVTVLWTVSLLQLYVLYPL